MIQQPKVNLQPVFKSASAITVTVGSSSIAYEDSQVIQKGKKVFYCLPGIGDLRHTYRFLAPKLAAEGHRVIVQDLRGVGDSGTKFESFSIEAIATDVDAVLSNAGVTNKVVLVGNSLSAAVCITYAATHPEKVEGIVTLGGFFRDMPADAYFRPLTPLLFNKLWGQPMWLSAFRGFFKKPPSDLDEYCKAVTAKMLSNCDHAGVIGAMIRSSKEPAWAKVPQLKCPVLLLMGQLDPDFKDPVAETKLVQEDIISRAGVPVTTAIVEGVGHYPHNEDPEAVLVAINDFIGSL